MGGARHSEELFAALDRLGAPSASELTAALGGISQPTLSRLIGEAGDGVLRLGRARSTRYARTRELTSLGRSQPLYSVDVSGRAEQLGQLHFLSGDRFWLEPSRGRGVLFEGLPPFVEDLSPQGYLGRAFARANPELGLPPRITDWSNDHLLVAIARRVDNGPGQLIFGSEAFDAFLAGERSAVQRRAYPSRARSAGAADPGSSAAGERPKFLAHRDSAHFIVKFADPSAGEAGIRWADLLVAELLALETVEAAGVAHAARGRILDVDGLRFLEVERFDRVGERGRRGTISLTAYDDGLIGAGGTWSSLAARMHAMGALTADDLRAVRWLEVFGQLIANSDRHRGNLTFFADGIAYSRVSLAPAYDMLPMYFMPREAARLDVIPDYVPDGPTAATADVWLSAAEHAHHFWTRVADDARITNDFRSIARTTREAVERTRDRAAQKLRG